MSPRNNNPPLSDTAGIDATRRRFLKVSLAGSVLLGTVSVAVSTAGCTSRSPPRPCDGCAFLTAEDKAILGAIVPVMLHGAIPEMRKARLRAVDEVVTGFDQTVAYFPPAVRREIRQLLDLLGLPLTRILLARLWPSWSRVNDFEIAAFLRGWQSSRFGLFRSGYYALHDLIVGAWYANPVSWSRIGYPGPPKLA